MQQLVVKDNEIHPAVLPTLFLTESKHDETSQILNTSVSQTRSDLWWLGSKISDLSWMSIWYFDVRRRLKKLFGEMTSCFQAVMFTFLCRSCTRVYRIREQCENSPQHHWHGEIPNKHALMRAQETCTVGDICQRARASDGHQARSSP